MKAERDDHERWWRRFLDVGLGIATVLLGRLLTVVGIGVLVPWLQSRTTEVYEAHAQIGPSQELSLSNVDPLPKLVGDIFNNGAVADTVRNYLNLPATASVVPERVQLVTAQDNIIFEVIGRDTAPEVAATMANLAADELTVELSNDTEAVGEFAVQRLAEAPATLVPTSEGGYLTIVVGLLAGAGLGIVATLAAVTMSKRPSGTQ